MSVIQSYKEKIIRYGLQVDWMLLLFLVLVMNVKLIVKITALLLFLFLNWRSVRTQNPFRQNHLYFYIIICVIALGNILLYNKAIQENYLFTAFLGVAYWLMALAASYLLFIRVKLGEIEKLHKTITIFFLLHALVFLSNFLLIMIETGTFNPYTFKGLNQKYYISTGDFVTGITFDNPVATAFISSFGVFYFLYRQQFAYSILLMCCVLLQGSNLTILLLGLLFLSCFFISSSRIQKSILTVHFLLIIVFLTKVSPQNLEYISRPGYRLVGLDYDLMKMKSPGKNLKTAPDSALTTDEKKKKSALIAIDESFRALSTDNVVSSQGISTLTLSPVNAVKHRVTEKYVDGQERLFQRGRYGNFIAENYSRSELDDFDRMFNWQKGGGKLIAYKQTINYFKQHRGRLLLGEGTGRFSSRLAFKATGLGMAGSFPASYNYINDDFRKNHLYTYLYYHSKEQMKHAAVNTPDSVYLQLVGEYGLMGLIAYLVFYLGFYIRKIKSRSYGLPLLILLSAGFLVEYWFEQLSIVILFELLMFLEMRDANKSKEVIV